MATFDVPTIDFRQKLEDEAYEVESATDALVHKAMAYITDLENRVSELETENLNLRDVNADLHRRFK